MRLGDLRRHSRAISLTRRSACIASYKLSKDFTHLRRCTTAISPSTAESSIENEKWIRLMQKTSALESNVLLPLNEKIFGPLDRKSKHEKLPSLPFVFLLGNHSSGKSSFINYLLQRSVQSTGVAPTDDGFTIIAPGNQDIDQDGPAFINDPDLGFSGLQNFGPALIQKTQLKVRAGIQLNFMLVDSPGMIDSPRAVQSYSHNPEPTHNASSQSIMNARRRPADTAPSLTLGDYSHRGYEFADVVRWYAERADVILLFFDPDKPGTTGETLSILTSSLLGMEHKLRIVLNKVDQFTKIHDFARAYGSLCWNLSKVIPLKDLPRIYTMCIPVNRPQGDTEERTSGLGSSLRDLDAMRDEVVHEVLRAPERRVDNLITNLYDAARLLQMHATVLEDVRIRYTREKWQGRALVASTLLGGNAIAAAAYYMQVNQEFGITLSTVAALSSLLLYWRSRNSLHRLCDDLMKEGVLYDHFRIRYGRQLAEGDEYVSALWKRVLPCLQLSIHTLGFKALPKIKISEFKNIDRILDQEVPALRRECAPSDTSLVHQIAQMCRARRE